MNQRAGVMDKIKGMCLIMMAAICFGTIPWFTKIGYANGLNPISFSLFRSTFAAIEIYIYLRLRNINLKVNAEQYLTILKASSIGYCVMMVTLLMSFNYLATGLAMLLHFIYPVATMVGAVLFFKEKVSWGKIIALIFSISGIYFLVGFGSSNMHIGGILLALISGIFYAYYVLLVAFGNIKDMNSFVLTYYISFFSAIVLFFFSLVTGGLSLNITYLGLLCAVMVAFTSNMIGMVAFQAGLKNVSPTTATILSTFEPITSLIIGIFFLGETSVWYHFIGVVLIIISVVMVALSEGKGRGRRAN